MRELNYYYMKSFRILVPPWVRLLSVAGCILLAPYIAQAKESSEPATYSDPIAIYRQAGISKEQEEKIKEFAKEFEEATSVRAQTMLNHMRQIRELSLEPDPDEQKVLTNQAEINKLQAQVAIDRIRLLLKIRKTLTTEQKSKLVALMKQPIPESKPTLSPGTPRSGKPSLQNP